MGQHNRPVGDEDLSGARAGSGENIRDGGAGFSGSSATSTGRLGGMGSTSDGAGSRDDDIDMVELETGGLTDSTDAPTLGDIVSDYTQSDADGSALDGPDDPDDRPSSDDLTTADLLAVDRAERGGAAGAPSTRSPRAGESGGDVGLTEAMGGVTGGLAGTSR